MIITYIHRIGWFIGLVLLQVLILNNVHIAGYATPFLYIYFILKFSSGTSRNELMLWAFFFGLTIDIFSDTTGIRDLEQAAEHIVANALYQIEVDHLKQVVFTGEMVRELLL